MNWYFVVLSSNGGSHIHEAGWMLAADDMELVWYALCMGYGIDIKYLGEANMQAFFPEVL